RLTENGGIAPQIAGKGIPLKKPVIYQDQEGIRKEITGGYRLSPGRAPEAQFELGASDPNLPPIIDPPLTFRTYFGGSGNENLIDFKVNAAGQVYLLGNTDSSSALPPHQTVSSLDPQGGSRECFLTKLANDGSTALYSVLFQGVDCLTMDLGPGGKVHLSIAGSGGHLRTLSESDMSLGLLQGAYDFPFAEVQNLGSDSNGNVYLIVFYTPETAPDFIYELQKVDSSGQVLGRLQLVAPPRYPGNQFLDQINGLDVDDSGNAYIIGSGV